MSEYPPNSESDEYDPIKDPLLVIVAGHVERLTDEFKLFGKPWPIIHARQHGDDELPELERPITANEMWEALAKRGEMNSDEVIEELTATRNKTLVQEAYDEISTLLSITRLAYLGDRDAQFDTADWWQARYGTSAGSIIVSRTNLRFPGRYQSLTTTQHTIIQRQEPLYRSTEIVTVDDVIKSVSATTGDINTPAIMRAQAVVAVEHEDLKQLYAILSGVWY